MNTLLQWAASPTGGNLWKWTALLTLAWLVHSWLRHGDARWRLILWRSVLVFSLVLPLTTLWSLPALTLTIREPAIVMPGQIDTVSSPTGAKARPADAIPARSAEAAAPSSPTATELKADPVKVPAKPIPWNMVRLAVWTVGCAWGAARMIWFRTRLARLRRTACPAKAELTELAGQIRTHLGVRGNFKLRISDQIQSPFVSGLWQPVIMLPLRLVETLSTREIAGLLQHEVAHLRGHDLWWSAGWRWLQVFGWFHPLVWKISAAHSLACEEEADRVASGRAEGRADYAKLLAQLALRVLALPTVETKLTLNGSAQIVRRLQQLQRTGAGVWKRRHTVAGLGLTALLFLVAVSCKVSQKDAETGTPSNGGFKQVTVVVQDENGQPIAGASVTPFAYRVKGIHAVDAYGWRTNVFGPKVAAITDADGKASLKYAVIGIPEEKEYTGALCFTVTDPDYSTVTIQDYPVDQKNEPIRMIRGITVEVSGYYGTERKPVTDITPVLADGVVPSEDWVKEGDGVLAYHKLAPGGHLIELMGRLPSGEIVYSDSTPFTAEKGKISQLALEMKPGIRLEGRLDDNVPRPVRNGRVMMDVRPKEWPALNVIEDYYSYDQKYGGRNFWHSYRPINADGTFVFESVPPGEADLVVLGDGFATKCEGQLSNRVNGVLVKGPVMAIPQTVSLTAPVTQIVVKTERTATLEFTATDRKGKPLEGIWVGMYPSVFRLWGMYGWMKVSSETPYREIPQLPDLVFSGKTDQDGRLVLRNIPAEEHGLDIESLRYQVQLQEPKGWRDRHVRTTFAPGETNRLAITMEPKGTDYIGTAR